MQFSRLLAPAAFLIDELRTVTSTGFQVAAFSPATMCDVYSNPKVLKGFPRILEGS